MDTVPDEVLSDGELSRGKARERFPDGWDQYPFACHGMGDVRDERDERECEQA